ncbi:hypothetical protein LPB72_01320 [Hydrogenophaga crassostreae]|uniref:Uncharacterized protein n=1 Tax=Hydrogenophaga crassostreae TaxID=1763535 RepID=A0A170AKD5_9BURK|nr:hypothetical protein [Hydrogenophaga crassostreae]AOW13871.1 hypothetical protein LPB072_14495 [Hydrogenophaga crassostreae]OAD44169.1 hypothetical protein LPB72_01320 [Hydrogenophaga crassostreae]
MKALQRGQRSRTATHAVITFRPMGETRSWPVATAYQDNQLVRWSSPCLDESHEHADMQAFEERFADCAWALPAFMRAMQWLDAVCFGAADLEAVRRACALNPEYGLDCVTEPTAAP